MEFQVKTKNGVVKRKLRLVKTERSRYRAIVDDVQEIGTVWKADGRVNKFRNHRLDGTHFVDRWFAKTTSGKELGNKPPYDEGFSSRFEAITELLEETLKIKRDWN